MYHEDNYIPQQAMSAWLAKKDTLNIFVFYSNPCFPTECVHVNMRCRSCNTDSLHVLSHLQDVFKFDKRTCIMIQYITISIDDLKLQNKSLFNVSKVTICLSSSIMLVKIYNDHHFGSYFSLSSTISYIFLLYHVLVETNY